MHVDVPIKVENVSKKFCKSLKKSMFYGLTDIGRNMMSLSSDSGRLRQDEFWALEDISIEVQRGETLGLIGPNGSGKTTLLKMMNGIFWPDKGKITVNGRVGALIAVGAGFHPLLTGRENIYINGAILGMSRREIDKRFDSIVDFSGIKDFLDSPVKHYSSGMFVRLGFAVAIHCEPEILLVDEVLSVGDIEFQAKCMTKMKELDSRGITKVYVSHNLNSVYLLCQRSVYISNGRIKYHGETSEVINEFKKDSLLYGKEGRFNENGIRRGTQEIQIRRVEFLDIKGQEKIVFKRGESFRIRIIFNARKKINNPEFGIGIFSEDGAWISNPTTRDHRFAIKDVYGDGAIDYRIESLPLNVGRYLVTIGCWDSTGHFPYDHHEKAYEFIVEDGVIGNGIRERFGHLYIPASWEQKDSV